MTNKRFGWDCPYKDNRDFCTVLLKPQICCPSICCFGLSDEIDEQQATISQLQDLCGESDGENAKLRIENKKLKAKLKEKEEDEKLYANEIVELRKTNEEWLQFKDLGGDY